MSLDAYADNEPDGVPPADKRSNVDRPTDRFADDELISLPAVFADCWRCDQSYDSGMPQCPLCAAENRAVTDSQPNPQNGQLSKTGKSPAIVRVVWAFAALATTSIVFALIARFTSSELKPGTLRWARQAFFQIGILELASTVIVVAAFLLIPVRPEWPQPSVRRRTFTWIAALPLFAGVLAINLSYHWWLQTALGIDDVLENMTGFPELWPWVLVTICVQPAIAEEVFFRHVALGAASEVTSAKQAIFISAVLFAMAHLGTPLSIPTLTLLGIVLGMLRFMSGGLLLPMLFHFFHNLVVVSLEHVL